MYLADLFKHSTAIVSFLIPSYLCSHSCLTSFTLGMQLSSTAKDSAIPNESDVLVNSNDKVDI